MRSSQNLTSVTTHLTNNLYFLKNAGEVQMLIYYQEGRSFLTPCRCMPPISRAITLGADLAEPADSNLADTTFTVSSDGAADAWRVKLLPEESRSSAPNTELLLRLIVLRTVPTQCLWCLMVQKTRPTQSLWCRQMVQTTQG